MARESIDQMVAEGFREVGVLILVFAILDKIVSGTITVKWTVWAVAVAVLAFSAGPIWKGYVKMGEYTSLIIGTIFLTVVFIGMLIYMRIKEKRDIP